MSDSHIVHVAVAVIKNSDGQYLVAKRPKKSHQGGLWEFPGGKVENKETVFEALKRELFEEVGISIVRAKPLIKISHDYGDKIVLLDVYAIDDFFGDAFGKEQQEIRWVREEEFSLYKFPLANLPIITAIQLPDKYMITGQFTGETELLERVKKSIRNGIKLIQFRAPNINEEEYIYYAQNIFSICEKENIRLLLNCSVDKYKKHSAFKFSHGLHLTSIEIKKFSSDDFDDDILISTSTHNEHEIALAEEKEVGFIVLSPVNKTLTHPDATPLGWEEFKKLSTNAKVPVYALGGMKKVDVETAKINGGQGIAAIGEFWND